MEDTGGFVGLGDGNDEVDGWSGSWGIEVWVGGNGGVGLRDGGESSGGCDAGKKLLLMPELLRDSWVCGAVAVDTAEAKDGVGEGESLLAWDSGG